MNFLPEEFDEILNIFRDESSEILQKFNNSLLRLEENPDDETAVLPLFQEAHSLKGAARMIGFDGIQTLAHKVEDTLSLFKNKKLAVTKEIISSLYKTSDFLQFLIDKSVSQKEDFKTPDLKEYLRVLDKINNPNPQENIFELNIPQITHSEEKNKDEETPTSGIEYFMTQTANIGAQCLEFLFVLEKYDEKEQETHFSILLDNCKSILSIFQKTSFAEITHKLDSLKKAIESIQRDLNTTHQADIDNLKLTFTEIVNAINSVFDTLSLPKITISQTQPIQNEDVSAEIQNDSSKNMLPQRNQIKEKLNYLSSVITQIKLDPSYLEKCQQNILAILNSGLNEEISQIYKKIFDILEQIKKNNIKPDNDVISIISQSINITKNIILNNENVETDDLSLLFQRLSIIEQMIDIADTKGLTQLTEDGEIKATQPEFQKVQDFFKTFEIGSIKTLRVDTKKLDTLISQMGELIVNGIKTKKHLYEIDSFTQKLNEWNLNLKKTVNYLKYFDKKNLSEEELAEALTAFNKQILIQFQNNQSDVSDLIKDLGNIYKHIQEDDIKLNHIIVEIENIVKSIRVLPLATIFHMFPRMIRDIAIHSGKEVELLISGSETTVDKKILEEIKMPLIHILRNSVDHGIEPKEERIKKNKPPIGKIQLSAHYEENKIIIEIDDDGYGINIQKIKKKALEKGLLTTEEINSMNNEQIMNLIFIPGFSTGDKITEISGRGIGLDIVQTKIAQLNGKIKVYSQLNKGAKVIIELPISMSTIKSFIVDIAGQKFAIPTSSIHLVQWLDKDKIFIKDGYKTIILNNQTIPIIDLTQMLHLKRHNTEKSKKITVVVLENANTQIAYIVDKLLGDQDILQKKLSPPVFKLKFISGITTLAEGDICLIFNVPELFKNTVNEIENIIENKIPHLLEVNSTEFLPEEKRIIIIDDSQTTLTLLKKILSNEGYQVFAYTNPQTALIKIKQDNFDLIISDISMPNLNGVDLIKEIKNDEETADTPVMIISTIPQIKVQKEIENLKISHYINKQSFNKKIFIKEISDLLQKKIAN
ncbi:MAG: hybrid sensor histidine kinase/response regulator [Candidatus Gastranaerophilales bacterium]|nr:hybrid sensor histidine kinase/response regulator [Candidatus Gastranaerophilales bacterium]